MFETPGPAPEIKEQEPVLPREELRAWVAERYGDKEDQYNKDLQAAHLQAIEQGAPFALEKLSNVLFVTKSFLQGSSPEEYARLTALYDKLMAWIKPRLHKQGQ